MIFNFQDDRSSQFLYIAEKDENGREKSRTIISKGEVIFHQLLTYSNRNQVNQDVDVVVFVNDVAVIVFIDFIVVVIVIVTDAVVVFTIADFVGVVVTIIFVIVVFVVVIVIVVAVVVVIEEQIIRTKNF